MAFTYRPSEKAQKVINSFKKKKEGFTQQDTIDYLIERSKEREEQYERMKRENLKVKKENEKLKSYLLSQSVTNSLESIAKTVNETQGNLYKQLSTLQEQLKRNLLSSAKAIEKTVSTTKKRVEDFQRNCPAKQV